MHYKEGDVREDGMVFYRYLRKKEYWVTAERLEEIRQKRKAYRTQCREEYKKRQAKKDAMDRNYIGKYDFSKNKYFVDISSSGKEIWLTKQQFDRFQARRKAHFIRFREKVKALPPTPFKVGDAHPDNPDLFVTRKAGNRCYWGDKVELQRQLEMRRRISRKKNQLYKYQRQIAFKGGRRKRGEVNEQGLIFWSYYPSMKEVWCTPEDFAARKEKEKNRESKRGKGRRTKLPKHRR